MRVISVIEQPEIIKKILKHLGLWEIKACPPSVWRARPPPKTNAPPLNVHIDYSDSQLPSSEDYLYSDPGYLIEASV